MDTVSFWMSTLTANWWACLRKRQCPRKAAPWIDEDIYLYQPFRRVESGSTGGESKHASNCIQSKVYWSLIWARRTVGRNQGTFGSSQNESGSTIARQVASGLRFLDSWLSLTWSVVANDDCDKDLHEQCTIFGPFLTSGCQRGMGRGPQYSSGPLFEAHRRRSKLRISCSTLASASLKHPYCILQSWSFACLFLSIAWLWGQNPPPLYKIVILFPILSEYQISRTFYTCNQFVRRKDQ